MDNSKLVDNELTPQQSDAAAVGLDDKRGLRYLLALVGVHVVVWTLLPLLVLQNSYYDILEELVWGRYWQWGYDKDPFLGSWLTALVTHVSGGALWAVYLLSQLAIAVTFIAVWRLARRFVSPAHALIAVFLLEGVYFYSLTSPEFNDNVLMLPLWALTCLYFYDALKGQKLWSWLFVGFFAGLAMMTKYYTGMLLLAMFIAVVFTPEGRRSFKHGGFYLALLVYALIITPNLLWLYDNHFVAFEYALNRGDVTHQVAQLALTHIINPLRFLGDMLAIMGPALAIFALCFLRKPRNNLSSADKRYLIIMGFGPLLLTTGFSVITGAHLRHMWGTPLFNLLGLFLIAWFAPQLTRKNTRRFIILTCGIFVWWMVYYVWSDTVYPYTRAKYNTQFELYAGKQLAKQVTDAWHKRYDVPLKYVAGDRIEVMNIAHYSADQPQAYFSWSQEHSQWINDANVKKDGAVFIWEINSSADNKLPVTLKQRFPGIEYQGEMNFNYVASPFANKLPAKDKLPAMQVGIAFLPPQ